MRESIHHVIGKFPHAPTLVELNMHDQVYKLIDNIGWRCFLDLRLPAFDILENFTPVFLFHYESNCDSSTRNVIRFKILGIVLIYSIDEFNEALGFITDDDFNDPK